MTLILARTADECIDLRGTVGEDAGLDDLLDCVEKLVDHLAKAREVADAKYRKLFELNNRLIEVNRSRANPQVTLLRKQEKRVDERAKVIRKYVWLE